MGFCAAAGEAYGSLPHGRVPLWEGPFGSSLCVCIPPGASVIASQRGQAGDQPRRQGCTVLGRGLPLSGAAFTPQCLREPLRPPEDRVPAVLLIQTLPDVQQTHETEGLSFERSPNSGKDWMVSSSVTAAACGMNEGRKAQRNFPSLPHMKSLIYH